MKILIAGAGKIGYEIAKMLADEGHDICVIDSDSEAINRVSNELDVICVEGKATNPETLTEAGAAEADILIAVTGMDEMNMVCGIAAKKLGTKHVFARVRDPEYISQAEFLREVLGLSVIINPEFECAKEISRILRFPSAAKIEAFSKGNAEMIEFRIPASSTLDGLQLKDLPQKYGAKVLVCVVERGGEAVIPNGEFRLRAGDRTIFNGAADELRKFFIAAGLYRKPVKSVLMLGGGKIAVYLTKMLEESKISVTIIDKSEARCQELCSLVPRAKIISGDGTRSDVLHEEGINDVDAFVALTGDDEDNIITSMYARHCAVEKIVTKVNREHFFKIIESVGLDCIVTPKQLIAQQVTRYTRAMHNSEGSSMESLYRLMDGKAEALEFRVGEGSACAGVPLRELKIKPNMLISAVIRGKESLIPNGATVILPGDHAVVVVAAGRLKELDAVIEGN